MTSTTLGLRFCRSIRVSCGGPNVPLTNPNMTTIRHIIGDGNCLFRYCAYVITGTEEQHMEVCSAIISHMYNIAHLLLPGHLCKYASIPDYISTSSHMDQDMTWGTEIEITVTHLLQTPIHNMQRGKWEQHSPHILDRTLDVNHGQISIHFRHPPAHFDVVHRLSVFKIATTCSRIEYHSLASLDWMLWSTVQEAAWGKYISSLPPTESLYVLIHHPCCIVFCSYRLCSVPATSSTTRSTCILLTGVSYWWAQMRVNMLTTRQCVYGTSHLHSLYPNI